MTLTLMNVPRQVFVVRERVLTVLVALVVPVMLSGVEQPVTSTSMNASWPDFVISEHVRIIIIGIIGNPY